MEAQPRFQKMSHWEIPTTFLEAFSKYGKRDGIDQSESQKMAPISIAQQREALSKPVEQTQLTQVDLALKNSIFW